jgi:hypothetical protein
VAALHATIGIIPIVRRDACFAGARTVARRCPALAADARSAGNASGVAAPPAGLACAAYPVRLRAVQARGFAFGILPLTGLIPAVIAAAIGVQTTLVDDLAPGTTPGQQAHQQQPRTAVQHTTRHVCSLPIRDSRLYGRASP